MGRVAEAVPTPDTTLIEAAANTAIKQALAFAIESTHDLQEAGEALRNIKTLRTRLEDAFRPTIKAAHQTHKVALAALATRDAVPAEAERIIKGKVGTYHAQQERIRQAEEVRLRDLARKEAEQRQLDEAARLDAEGHTEAAEEVFEQPVETPPVVVPSSVPKVDGVSTRKITRHRIVDASKIPRPYMKPNDQAIAAVGRALGAQASIDGVEFYQEDVVSVRGL